jgi:hypothetical protein
MDKKRIAARDRRSAAVHEAGHLVVARQYGLKIHSAWIVPNETKDPRQERTWDGQVQITTTSAPEIVRRMVGVAGAVAEHLWRGRWIEDYSPEGNMSESDWHLAGCNPDEPDDAFMHAVEEVGQLFERDGLGWQELIAESRRLIIAGRPSPKG